MPRGGARVNSGPPPDPNALRRDRKSDQAGWTTLPAKRRGRTPRWPLKPDIALRAKRTVVAGKLDVAAADLADAVGRRASTLTRKVDGLREQLVVLDYQLAEQDGAERALWKWSWTTPQSAAWATDPGCLHAVAMWVRHQVLAEHGSVDDEKLANGLADRLGLNPAAMQRLRWKVAGDQVATARAARRDPAAQAPPGRSSAAARLKALSGGST